MYVPDTVLKSETPVYGQFTFCSIQWDNRMSMTTEFWLVTLIPVIGCPNLWHSLRKERSAYQAALVT